MRPRSLSASWPTAYTPWWTRISRRDADASSISFAREAERGQLLAPDDARLPRRQPGNENVDFERRDHPLDVLLLQGAERRAGPELRPNLDVCGPHADDPTPIPPNRPQAHSRHSLNAKLERTCARPVDTQPRRYTATVSSRDRRPRERLDRPRAARAAHLRGPRRVGQQLVDALRDRRARTPPGRAARSPPGSCSNGTSSPVTPSCTTSTIPPVAVATTAASHAIASRLTIPSGS